MKIKIKIIDTKNKRSVKILQNFMLLLFLTCSVLYLTIVTMTKYENISAIFFLLAIVSFTLFLLIGLIFLFLKVKFIGEVLVNIKTEKITITHLDKISSNYISNISFILNDYTSNNIFKKKVKRLPIYGNYIVLSEREKYEFYPDSELDKIEKIVNIKFERKSWIESKTLILFKDSLRFISSIFYD